MLMWFPCCRGKKEQFQYLKIYGCYIDIANKPQKTYIANTYEAAMERAPIVKSFLYPIGLCSAKYNLYRYYRYNQSFRVTGIDYPEKYSVMCFCWLPGNI